MCKIKDTYECSKSIGGSTASSQREKYECVTNKWIIKEKKEENEPMMWIGFETKNTWCELYQH
jgi:hypothetical protein